MGKSGSRATINGFLLPYIIQNLSIDGQTAARVGDPQLPGGYSL